MGEMEGLKERLQRRARLVGAVAPGMQNEPQEALDVIVKLERENAAMARTLLAWEYVSNGWPLSGEDFNQRRNLTQRGRSVIGDRDV